MVICKQPYGGEQQQLISLAPGDRATLYIGADTKAIFKNVTNAQASVKLKVTGTTNLSMGGPNY